MAILLLLIIHWYASLFFQSVFHHRYAAHGLFTMSRGWERTFFVGCFITQGSSYISAHTYGIMHRLHHAHTDKEDDPHSPENTPNLFAMMWDTRNNYRDIHTGKTEVAEKFKKGLPEWFSFDRFAHSAVTKIGWIVVYVLLYCLLATQWWMFLFLPFTLLMGAFQGAVVNWWAHRFGYENFSMDNTSKNILPVDVLFWGEAYHNNHHRYPSAPNNARRWFEFDMGYMAMRLLHGLKVIKLKGK
ncbi:MAG TPA: acyl-CoA desaturase [Flavipsychrobacter sp.]|nr:acyl-CoA desaturase [Flavipsychrobacter sp.]